MTRPRLSELLGLPAPALPSLAATAATSVLSTGGSSFHQAGEGDFSGGPWADEEEKNFYEDLRELRGEVPGSVLGIKADKKEEVDKGKEDGREAVEAAAAKEAEAKAAPEADPTDKEDIK